MTQRLVTIAAIIMATMPAAADEELDVEFEKDVLIIEASVHGCHRFDVYLALDKSQQARGLMHVRELPATTGMLFVYDGSRRISMWMKNTYIPLDIVFARADGTVSSVAHATEPLSLRSIASKEPVTYVLELNAGTANRLSIDENSRLFWVPAKRDDGSKLD